jgi:RNA polymerase sigma factor (sigma-70 family)
MEDAGCEITEGTLLLPASVDAANWEEHHEILRLLNMLPPRQRQVVAWTFDGYSPAEIANELRITPEAVRASLFKARRTLAEHIGLGKDRP